MKSEPLPLLQVLAPWLREEGVVPGQFGLTVVQVGDNDPLSSVTPAGGGRRAASFPSGSMANSVSRPGRETDRTGLTAEQPREPEWSRSTARAGRGAGLRPRLQLAWPGAGGRPLASRVRGREVTELRRWPVVAHGRRSAALPNPSSRAKPAPRLP